MGADYVIAEILVYPVKACRGVSASSAAISSTGFLFDREWMVVKAENGRCITMSRSPKLALVQPSMPAAALRGESVPSNAFLVMGADYVIAEILVYPVKACRGVSASSAAISSTGFLFDREWMVVKAENGRCITMSRSPKLALVQPSMPAAALRGESVPSNAFLEINAPGMKTLSIPLQRSSKGNTMDVGFPAVFYGQGVDEGSEAAAWFSRYLDLPVRLVRFDPSKQKEKRQAEEAPQGYVTGFQNTGQFMFVSEASLDEVNSYFPNSPFPMNRFRPNIVVRGPPSFEEDKWRQFIITHKGNQLNFSYALLRGICKVPTIDQDKPDLDNVEPNKTMFSFRSGPHVGMEVEKVKKAYFGSYFVCDSTLSDPSKSKAQVVGVGDHIDVITMKQG